jgi:hypothetical protein
MNDEERKQLPNLSEKRSQLKPKPEAKHKENAAAKAKHNAEHQRVIEEKAATREVPILGGSF